MAELWPCTIEEYHADTTAIGNTMREDFLRRPSWYRAWYVDGPPTPKPAKTDALRFGTLVHMAVLEPERFATETVIPPHVDRRTKAGKAEWAAFVEEAGDKLHISPDEMVRVSRIVDAVAASKDARALLERDGDVETAIRWRNAASGLELKCRPDKVAGNCLIDLKTSSDPRTEPFLRSALNYGYVRSAAQTVAGYAALTGEWLRWVWVVVDSSKDAPDTEVFVYELHPGGLDLGHRQCEDAYVRLAECLDKGDWRTPAAKRPRMLALPEWSERPSDYEVR